MEGVERGGGGKWKVIKERLGFVGLACCGGPVWGSSNMRVREEDDEQEEEEEELQQEQEVMMNLGELLNGSGQDPDLDCVGQTPSSGINLATALAAERQFRTDEEGWEGGLLVGPTSPNSIGLGPDSGLGHGLGTPGRVSLLRLLEEGDGAEEDEKEKTGGRNDMLCCVCMGRKKGAAFIPCGHTFCRVCSREIWLNRGNCPLCNRSINEILDIF